MFHRFRTWTARWRRRAVIDVGTDDDALDDQNRVLGLNPSRIPSGKQWRFLPSFLSPLERRWLNGFVILALVSGLATLAIIGLQHIARTPKSGGTVTVGLVGTPQFINPILARPNTVDADLTKLLFRGLARITSSFESVPDLAESITASDDLKTYTVVLKPNVTWSDGEPMTADDLKFTIDTIKDIEFGSPLRSLFQTATVEVKDERTAVVTIEKPLAAFASYFEIGLLPRHAWSDATPQTMALAELNVKPISNGPYKFFSVTKDRNGSIKALTFVKNKSFVGQVPYINRLVVKFYSDRALAIDALKHESIDLLGNVTLDEDRGIAKKFVRTSLPISELTAIFLNQQGNPALKSLEVRKALAMAVDRNTIVSSLFTKHVRAITGPVLPGYPGFAADISVPGFDLAAANQVLEEAGWKKNEKGIRQKGAQQLVFAITTPNDAMYNALAETLATAWEGLGAGVEVKKVDPTVIQRENIRPRKYEVLLFGQIHDADGDLYPFWHSSQQRDPGINLSMFYDKNLDTDLEDARVSASRDQRATEYRDFQSIIANQVPAIFLFQDLDVVVHRSALRGLPNLPLVSPSDVMGTAESWYVKTRLSWSRD